MRNASGASALIVAAAKCHPEVIKVLIEEGANPNAQDTRQYNTPLMFIAGERKFVREKRDELTELLISSRADVNLVSGIPVRATCGRGCLLMIAFVLWRSVGIRRAVQQYVRPRLHVRVYPRLAAASRAQCMHEACAHVDGCTNFAVIVIRAQSRRAIRDTALSRAAQRGYSSTVTMLLEMGADLDSSQHSRGKGVLSDPKVPINVRHQLIEHDKQFVEAVKMAVNQCLQGSDELLDQMLSPTRTMQISCTLCALALYSSPRQPPPLIPVLWARPVCWLFRIFICLPNP